MAFRVDEQILRLEVAENDALVVHVFHGQNKFGSQKLGDILIQQALLVEDFGQVTILAELNGHVEITRGLERENQLENVRVIERLHDVCFAHRVLYLVVVDEMLLFHHLESEDISSVSFLALEDATERALANDFDDVEIRESDVLGNVLAGAILVGETVLARLFGACADLARTHGALFRLLCEGETTVDGVMVRTGFLCFITLFGCLESLFPHRVGDLGLEVLDLFGLLKNVILFDELQGLV